MLLLSGNLCAYSQSTGSVGSRASAYDTKALATNALTQDATLTPDALVRLAINKALATSAQPQTMRYRFTKVTEHGTFVKDVIETQQGDVSRLITINGKPLGTEQEAAEKQRLEQLLGNPDEQKHHYAHELETERQINRLMREIPDAFVFHRVEDLPDQHEDQHQKQGSLIHLAFAPNPKFSPPDFASRIFAGMAGEVWIDPQTERMVRLKAHLNHSIHWGFGLLATFAQGGTVDLYNQQVLPNYWTITRLKLDLTGTALLFKSIQIHLTEIQDQFAPLPSSVDWHSATQMLLDKHS